MRPAKISTAVSAIALTLVPTLLVAQQGQRQRVPRAPRFSALPEGAAAPVDNPLSAERIALGRLLFWDPVLSGSRDVACATCHHPRFGYTDGRDLSIGVSGVGLGESRRFPPGSAIPFVKRNSPTILNTGFNGIDRRLRYDPATAPMFWDRRARSLEVQALEPIKSFEEMRGDAYGEAEAVAVVVARL
ncbi:MAG: cytochrome-c peroxidase, partial [Gemmatimonadetes bacterium]|nr:cytochrome-c peroxidase [Gemmatimonadota bacterium]